MRRDDTSCLLDMLVAASEAVEFTDGLSYSEFVEDRRSQLAVLKLVEIVGEAASRLSAETKERSPDMPWREVVGMRNRLAHAYFAIDLRVVWETVKSDFPVLITQLEPLVPPENEG